MAAIRTLSSSLCAHAHAHRDASLRALFNFSSSSLSHLSLVPRVVTNQCRFMSSLSRVRNIGVMAHIDAGKTTTSERMLFYSGFTRNLGDVDDGDTVLDYMKQERERGITINSAAITFNWAEHTVNLIDTPGHVDFTVEVERALRVMDGAVAGFDAVAGGGAQSLTVWRQATRYNLAKIAFVNKMDRRAANLHRTVDMMRTKLGAHPLVLQMPLGQWGDFYGMVDLVNLKKYEWAHEGDGREFKVTEITGNDGEIYEKAIEARTVLAEAVAEVDDEFLEKIDDFSNAPPAEITAAVRRATRARKAVPVLCGSALKNKGVQPLLDAICEYLPSPEEAHHPDGISPDPAGDLCALAFKVVHDQQRGAMVYFRVYRGKLNAKMQLHNNTRKTKEKMSRLLRVYADEYREIQDVEAGHIAVALGLKKARTGDTLVALNGNKNLFLEGLRVPDPVFFCTVEPCSSKDEPSLVHALECMQREDPSFHVHTDPATGQRVLSGMGELHLEIIRDRLTRDYNLEIEAGAIQVAYKETITSEAEATVEFSGMIAGKKQNAMLTVSVSPLENTENSDADGQQNYVFVNSLPGSSNLRSIDPKGLNVVVKEGIQAALSRGALLSYPVANVEIALLDGSIGQGSSPEAISACMSQALSKAISEAQPALLEPVMNLEISIDGDDYVGGVLQDLTSQRRAEIQGLDREDTTRVVKAEVPLSSMVGYSSILRSLTGGHSNMSLQFSRYRQVDRLEEAAVLKKLRGY
eukprot:comp14806_c0_seq1/m.11252 comp14806_c0_seq1/g.11252  ORF comp14806_c0_seq1/g.11252 comp14806_c0_seq1/m.11252 type:complete len:750 (-) comp14806_c0_seq1:162-2411(-)